MGFSNHKELSDFFIRLGVTQSFYKMLAENDNSKQQLYLGGSFDVLQQLPFGEITVYPDNKEPNYKAPMDFYWINDSLNYEKAPNTQLILYPKYPEVRLSGFLKGCPTAPSKDMQPIPKEQRSTNNSKDGRVLILGITPERKVFGYLAPKHSSLSKDIENSLYNVIPLNERKVLNEFPLETNNIADKHALIIKLRELVNKDWTPSVRMYPDGIIRPYTAPNGGGYTMEANFGIIPNGDAEPDYKGWELKAYSKTTLTLMTPEPDKGLYHDVGAKEFAIKYGHIVSDNERYFTGPFVVNKPCKISDLRMVLNGFNETTGKLENISGGIMLIDNNNEPVAIWSFSGLLKHWCNKHQHACYMRYDSKKENENIFYKYKPIVHLGEGTEFPLFLQAMSKGLVRYDPAIKVIYDERGNSKGKARSQFRITVNNLTNLYYSFKKIDIFNNDF